MSFTIEIDIGKGVLAYENQEWPQVPDQKISVEDDMLWHNPNRRPGSNDLELDFR